MSQEEEVLVSQEEQTPELVQSQAGKETFGFKPLQAAPEERREETKKESPACKALRDNINRLICRYPQLRLRSSEATLRTLSQYDEAELNNILQNAQNDLRAIRGSPMADTLINLTAGFISRWVPDFLPRCQNDSELKSDVESEATLLFGACSNRTNIVFRMANNLHNAVYQPQTAYPDQLANSEQQEASLKRKGSDYFSEVQNETRKRPRERVGSSSGEDSTSDSDHL